MKAIIVLVLLLWVSSVSQAGDVDSRSWPDTSGMFHSIESKDSVESALKELDNNYQMLVARIRELHSQKEVFLYIDYFLKALDDSQNKWHEYRRSVCEAEGIATGAGSHWQTVHANECEMKLIEERNQYFGKLLTGIQDGF